jgi:uroporphyrinogen-III synthase
LITHPEGSWPDLSARFHGTDVALQLAETASQVDPLDPEPGDRALRQLGEYAWLVVTSVRGATALLRRLASLGAALPQGLRVAAVGPATAKALRSAGIDVSIVPEEATGSGLASSLRPELKAGSKVLVVRPEGAAGPLVSALAASRGRIDVAPLYRTVASEHAGALAAAAIGGAFQAVVFTAPSSLDRWLDAAGASRALLVEALSKTARVAIGPTTAAHLAEAGLPAVAVASVPTEDAIGDAISAAFVKMRTPT